MATLGTWPQGSGPQASLAQTTSTTGLTVSALAATGGWSKVPGDPVGNGVVAADVAGDASLAAAYAANRRIAFTITPAAGYSAVLTTLLVQLVGQNQPVSWDLGIYVNGSQLATRTFTGNSFQDEVLLDLSGIGTFTTSQLIEFVLSPRDADNNFAMLGPTSTSVITLSGTLFSPPTMGVHPSIRQSTTPQVVTTGGGGLW